MLYRFEPTQLIKQPTRIFERSTTLIDIILSSNPEKISECNVKHLSVSDHSLVYAIGNSSVWLNFNLNMKSKIHEYR